jgi:hypothetical protein
MADTKISALTAASVALGTQEIPVNEGGTSKKLTVAQIAALIGAPAATSMPGGPATNQRVFRTDLGLEFYYDGTRWVSSQMFEFSIAASAVASSASYPMGAGEGAVASCWLVDIRWGYAVTGATHNASNYWTLQFMDCNRTPGVDGGVLVSDKSSINSTTVNATPTALGQTWPVYATSYGSFNLVKVGSPNSINIVATVRYRLIRT